MPNPMIPVGTLNRVRASVKFTSHSELNVSASFLAKEGVELSFQGNITEFLPAMTGAVQSPQPYMILQARVHLLRSQALGKQFKAQWEKNATIGDAKVYKGYDTIPLDMALEREIIDLDEVAGELIFFTCVSSINSPEQAKGTMDVVNGVWSTQCSLLNLTEWIASLPTLKSAASSGATANTSSATSSTTQPEPDSETSVQIPA
ncbi:hypothetical protein BvCmsB39A_00419 [Escherichia coli]|uniref:hypothetical protein n=1 Tax=Escherichia coli TaxID=562 RepID=UPI0010B3C992|nr:hypothetical protein [Escherichia coli]GCK30400.1 hypothetical protein BvCmsB39A_00419 [Escherichia coli]